VAVNFRKIILHETNEKSCHGVKGPPFFFFFFFSPWRHGAGESVVVATWI
jgi:hypothetical protein